MGMYITNKQFEFFEKLLAFCESNRFFNRGDLTTEELFTLDGANISLLLARQRRRRDNARTYEIIKEKRKTDPFYGGHKR